MLLTPDLDAHISSNELYVNGLVLIKDSHPISESVLVTLRAIVTGWQRERKGVSNLDSDIFRAHVDFFARHRLIELRGSEYIPTPYLIYRLTLRSTDEGLQ